MDVLYTVLKFIVYLPLVGFGIVFFLIAPFPIIIYFIGWIFGGVEQFIDIISGLDGNNHAYEVACEIRDEIMEKLDYKKSINADELFDYLTRWYSTRPEKKRKITEEPIGRLLGVFFPDLLFIHLFFSRLYVPPLGEIHILKLSILSDFYAGAMNSLPE